MHIPDGYLSPITCIVMFAIMLPIWIYAAKWAKEKLSNRAVPLLAMLSSFSFVVMMFNWPVPDGTTAHMVGGTLIAIIMGPWAAVIGVSVALMIQAFFFADGGITAFGANAFNMAFLLPFSGYLIYKALMKFFNTDNIRARAIAAGVAAYVAINIAAFAAAIEFGVQPYIAKGYCPYGIEVAVPAMLFAHLVTAGPVAAVVTSAVVAYIYRHRPDLMEVK